MSLRQHVEVALDPEVNAHEPESAVLGVLQAATSTRQIRTFSGATKERHLADADAALDITLTDDEVRALEGPYVARKPTYFQ